MKYFNYAVSIFVIFILFGSLLAQKAYAYLDLGSGSYIFQLFIGTLLGILLVIRLSWGKIKDFLINLFSKKQKGLKK
jgi:hypothetical protein